MGQADTPQDGDLVHTVHGELLSSEMCVCNLWSVRTHIPRVLYEDHAWGTQTLYMRTSGTQTLSMYEDHEDKNICEDPGDIYVYTPKSSHQTIGLTYMK